MGLHRKFIAQGFFFVCLGFIAVSYVNCSKKETSDPGPTPTPNLETPAAARKFYMGYNPWPYDATVEAIDWTYQTIRAKGDIISQHIEEGVPWPESYQDQAFPIDYQNSLQDRVTRTGSDKKIFLSINPINPGRNGLALYRGSSFNMPLPAPWNSYALNSVQVKTAYLKYAKRMIALFKPDYLAIGIEVNLLMRNSPSLWNSYTELHQNTYSELKKLYPNLPILVSFDSNAILDGYSNSDNPTDQHRALQDLLPFVDQLGISLHPFLSTIYFADSLPSDMFDKIFALTTKPISITESSYTAQVWTLKVGTTTLTFNGSLEKQVDFTRRLLAAAQKYSAPFVVGFSIRDYDQLWNKIGEPDSALPWRDTGLYDEAGLPRPALDDWNSYLAKPHY